MSKKNEKSDGSSSGRYVGLYDAKSVRYIQFQDVTSMFSDLMSP